MAKITFLGAGSTVFAKNILGDTLQTKVFENVHIALYDIDKERLNESKMMIENLNKNGNKGRAIVTAHLGVGERKEALRDSTFIVNAIQVGGYEPSTVIDFEIPKKFGLQQTIGDTLGIGGIFRGLRTANVMLDIAKDIEAVCPDAWLLNYTNPMSILTGAMLKGTKVKVVGLCHSVQVCLPHLAKHLELGYKESELSWKIAGINHMAWLLEAKANNKDIYPEIKEKAAALNKASLAKGGKKHGDMIRMEIMRHFGYYITESSEHNAEYTPYWIKSQFPELIEEYNIPLDEYPRRCVRQIEKWKTQKESLINNSNLKHTRTHEYGSFIMEAIETGVPFEFGGNVLNKSFITNLPYDSVVEVPCIANKNGIQGIHVGALPTQCAALNMTNINVHELTIQAALTKSRDAIYHAAYLDPHTAAELPLNKIRELCDALIKAHGNMMPKYK